MDSDHNPVVATVGIQLKKIIKKKGRTKLNIDRLKDAVVADRYDSAVSVVLEKQDSCNEEASQKWVKLKQTLTSNAETVPIGDEIKHQETVDHNRDDQHDGREEKMEDL